jgi:hypothetical protein
VRYPLEVDLPHLQVLSQDRFHRFVVHTKDLRNLHLGEMCLTFDQTHGRRRFSQGHDAARTWTDLSFFLSAPLRPRHNRGPLGCGWQSLRSALRFDETVAVRGSSIFCDLGLKAAVDSIDIDRIGPTIFVDLVGKRTGDGDEDGDGDAVVFTF